MLVVEYLNCEDLYVITDPKTGTEYIYDNFIEAKGCIDNFYFGALDTFCIEDTYEPRLTFPFFDFIGE